MKFKITFLAIIMALGFNAANAQVAATAKNQHKRIKEGVKSGELTKGEAVNLRNDQKEIRQEAKEAKADGVVTKDERKDIRKDQRQESRKIFRKKNNLRVRQ